MSVCNKCLIMYAILLTNRYECTIVWFLLFICELIKTGHRNHIFLKSVSNKCLLIYASLLTKRYACVSSRVVSLFCFCIFSVREMWSYIYGFSMNNVQLSKFLSIFYIRWIVGVRDRSIFSKRYRTTKYIISHDGNGTCGKRSTGRHQNVLPIVLRHHYYIVNSVVVA